MGFWYQQRLCLSVMQYLLRNQSIYTYVSDISFCRTLRFKTSVRSFSSNQNKLGDHYGTLDVTRTSTQSEIKDAYYKLSKKYHPDKNPGNDAASEKFRQITEAYDVLSNVDLKRDYDRNLAIRDAKSSPISPYFREVSNKTDKPAETGEYNTRIFQNRRNMLDKENVKNASFYNPTINETDEVNPFSFDIDPQSIPKVEIKKYKPLSSEGWVDPDESQPFYGKEELLQKSIIYVIAGSMAFATIILMDGTFGKKYLPPPLPQIKSSDE